ncbi:malignant T-cell-amplified sequence 1 isoform 3-T3 [Amazona ochrocephala]
MGFCSRRDSPGTWAENVPLPSDCRAVQERLLGLCSVENDSGLVLTNGGLWRFDEKENVSNCIQLKTSVIKGIKNQLIDQFPVIEPWLNQIMPKKDPVKIVRCHEHIEILTVNGELLFFRQREGIFYPTLRLLHKLRRSTKGLVSKISTI